MQTALRGLRRAGCLASVICLAAVAAGCGSGGLDGTTTTGVTDPATFGYGHRPDSSVVYQPDVVLVDGGSKTIRSVSKDGFTYVIDGRARGAENVRPGKVMFVTSEAVGRVVRTEPSGGDLAVTLSPVKLTDVVRDGHFVVDQPIDLERQTFQPVPDLLGDIVDTGPTDGLPMSVRRASGPAELDVIAVRPALHIAAERAQDDKTYGTKVGDWDVQAYAGSSAMGLTVGHSTAAPGLKVNFDIQLIVQNLRVQGDVLITNGILPQPRFRIDGVKGMKVTVAAGAAGGLSDNKKVKIEVPVELKEHILIGGFPATLKQTFKFLVETAFSAKNGNLKASGEWGLDGPIGYSDAGVSVPAFSVRKSIVESLTGVSVGVDGIVVAAEFRFGLMIGLPVAGAGPYVGVVASIGLTNGSAAGHVGLPLAGPSVKCRGSTLVAIVRAGAGISLSTPLSKAIEQALKVKIPAETDLARQEIVNRTVVDPDVPLCRAGV